MKFLRSISWRTVLARAPLFALAAMILALPVGYGVVEYTTRPQFCASCHNMVPYVDSWKESSHHMVQCVDCHYEPGILETAEGKFKALSQLAKYVTATAGTKPWAEVSDNSCMRSGCHSTRLLAGEVDFEIGGVTIAFDHAPHLLEMRRSKKLRCTSCHSQIVQGEHLSVTPSTCFLCHFKSAAEEPELSACDRCHGAPEGKIDLEGFQFEHTAYTERGVACSACHTGITRGEGEVPKRRCGSCHAVVEHIERYGDTEFLHRQHVTEHKVDCVECHTEITHHLQEKRGNVESGECANCHRSGHGLAEAFQRGEGGRHVERTPGAMWLARVACNGCHMHLPGFDAAEQRSIGAREVACISCHGPGFSGMLGRWQDRFGKAIAQAGGEVDGALAAAADRPDMVAVVNRLRDARHDVDLVRSDGSSGAHNPWFARKLLASAAAEARDAWAHLDPTRTADLLAIDPPFATELNCAAVCHMGIEDRPIGLAGTSFEHARHLGRAGDCGTCHGVPANGETHGATKIGANDCAACHHAPERVAQSGCVACHAETDAFLRGVEDGIDEPEQMMAKITCVECHGDPPAADVHGTVQTNCVRCHGEKHEDTLADWLDFSNEWFEEAEDALAPLREKPSEKPEAAAALAEAEALLARLRRVRPAHNVLLFDQLGERFQELVKSARR